MGAFITDDQIEAALEYLESSADEAAEARADREYCEEYRKVIKAEVMAEHKDQPLGAQEREAYCSQNYQAHLLAIRDAVKMDEKFRFLRQAKQARIDAWQTMSANYRGMERIR